MKTLFLDIETSPTLADVWRFYNENISIAQVRRSTRVICFAAKWAGDSKVLFRSAFDTSVERTAERATMIGMAWELLDQADVVVTYNGDHFDLKTLNREFWLYDLPQPAPYQSIDLLKVVKKNFLFPSNKLDFIVRERGLGRKMPHKGHDMWVGVQAGDTEAQQTMRQYNIHDVELLETLHDSLDSWLPLTENKSMGATDPMCPYCGGLVQRRGCRYTATGKYQRYWCTICGRWSQDTKRLEGSNVKPL
jgi:hypothetical protein